MADKKTATKKTTKAKGSKWTTVTLKPVDLSKVQFANKPTKK